MNEFHEIVDLQQFTRCLQALAIALPLIAVAVSVIVGVKKKHLGQSIVKGIVLGLWGPLIYALWLLYSFFVRYNPQTGEAGLHRVSVLLINVAIFAVIGVLLGFVYSRIFRPVTTDSNNGLK